MALVTRVDPETGQEYQEEVEEQGGAPAPLMPVLPQGLVQEPAQTPTPAPPLQQGEKGFVERFGGPSPRLTEGKGLMETLGHFASSDLGRNLIGSLGVGLAGIRNPRDGGVLQQKLMDMHYQGMKERSDRTRTADAMGGVFEALNSAHAALSKGDTDTASKLLAPLAKNSAVMSTPAAMQAVLAMQAQLTRHSTQRSAVEALSKGPEPTSFRDFMTRATAVGMPMEDIIKMAPSMVRETKPQIIHSDKLGIWEYIPGKEPRQLVKAPEGEVGTPMKYGDMNDEAKKGVNWLSENVEGFDPKSFLGELNHPEKARREAATAAMGVGMAQVRNRVAQAEEAERKTKLADQREKERLVRQEKAVEAVEKDEKLTWSDKPQEGALWYNKETRRNVLATEPEAKMRESMKSGKYMRFGSPTQTEMITAAESAYGAIDKLYALAIRNPKAIAWGSMSGGAGGAAGGVASYMSADVAEVQSLIGLGLSNIVRLQGERGNLSEGDITRAKDAIAGLSSGTGYKRKLETVLELINRPLVAKGFAPLKFTSEGLKDEAEKPSGVRTLPGTGLRY